MRKDAVLSAQIEGTQAPLMDLLEVEVDVDVPSLLDPLVGEPLFYVARHLTEEPSPRGIHPSMLSLQWDTRSDGLTLPWAKKDGTFDHAVDAASYWARAFGAVSRARIRPVPIRSWRDLDAVALLGRRLQSQKRTGNTLLVCPDRKGGLPISHDVRIRVGRGEHGEGAGAWRQP